MRLTSEDPRSRENMRNNLGTARQKLVVRTRPKNVCHVAKSARVTHMTFVAIYNSIMVVNNTITLKNYTQHLTHRKNGKLRGFDMYDMARYAAMVTHCNLYSI